MLRNIGETIPARGGSARFLPKHGRVQMSLDLSTSLGWNSPHETSVASFLHPDDCNEVIDTVHAISSGDLSGAVSRSRVADSSGIFQTLDWSFFRNPDPSIVCGVGMLPAFDARVNTGRLLKEVVEGMTDGFAIFDPDDRLILSNAAYRSVLPGFGPAKLHGLEFSQIAELCSRQGVYDGNSTSRQQYVASRIAAHKSGHSVLFQSLGSGRVERIEERRLPGGHIVAVHADVTEMHRGSEEVRRKASATLEFVSVISHELRTPLVGLMGMIDELLEATSTEDRDRIAKTIRRSGDQLMDIANSALDLTKIENGRMQLEQAPFHPVNCLEPLIDRYSLIARRKELGFVSSLDPDIGMRIGDQMRYIQIVENLVSNAVKFTSKGHVEISVSKEKDDLITVTVKDTGIGISAAFISHMMKPFTQQDPSLTRNFGGTGLGLSVVSNLVNLMGGKISCASVPGEGATFSVQLPLQMALDSIPEEIPPSVGQVTAFAGKRVLIADDNEINRIVMEGLFQRMQFETEMAKDGEEALVLATSNSFDLLMLDISMPKIDGIKVLQQLRQSDKYKDTPIIAVTANVLPDELEAYKEAGFSACVTKPFRKDDLAKVLIRFLQPSR